MAVWERVNKHFRLRTLPVYTTITKSCFWQGERKRRLKVSYQPLLNSLIQVTFINT